MNRIMKGLAGVLFGLTVACGPTPAPKPPTPPVMALAFDVVACIQPEVANYCNGTAAIVTVTPNPPNGSTPRIQTTDANGYAMVSALPDTWQGVDIDISAAGYILFHTHTTTAALITMNATKCGADPCHNAFQLQSALPAPPTRDEALNLCITFQGLTVQTQQFGTLPGFEAALPWLTPADRLAYYAAKHASTTWCGASGDTHALIHLPSGPPLYDEPNQPYSADRFGPLDWTAGNTRIDDRLPNLVTEVAQNGFRTMLLFLGGDNGAGCDATPMSANCAFPIAMKQLDLVSDALSRGPVDLRPYVIPIPGYDGVFYGYSPDQIVQWGQKCRTLFVYCGLEHSTGHIPVGEGDSDWLAGGRMQVFDLILSEFNDDQFDDTVWQIAPRLIGSAYVRPANQPASDDPPPVSFYLREPTPRGFVRDCAFEFGLYGQVHGVYDAAHVNANQRPYFQRVGYGCGG